MSWARRQLIMSSEHQGNLGQHRRTTVRSVQMSMAIENCTLPGGRMGVDVLSFEDAARRHRVRRHDAKLLGDPPMRTRRGAGVGRLVGPQRHRGPVAGRGAFSETALGIREPAGAARGRLRTGVAPGRRRLTPVALGHAGVCRPPVGGDCGTPECGRGRPRTLSGYCYTPSDIRGWGTGLARG